MREYTVLYQATDDDGTVHNWTSFASYNSVENRSEQLSREYAEIYKADPNFKILNITCLPTDKIDPELSKRMQAVREMCELGHKVRAETKIRNRQPLRSANVIFTDKSVQDYMIYIDCGKRDFENILSSELNVDVVNFVDDIDSFFDYNLKPNFRTLGKKGFGKLAQKLKEYLAIASNDKKLELMHHLKHETVELMDIPLTMEDIEVEYIPKKGYASSNSKVGAIILDTNISDTLFDRGLIADFRSLMQGIRKEANLKLTDRISLEVFCELKTSESLQRFGHSLERDLLATSIKYHTLADFDPKNEDLAHKVQLDNKTICVLLYKEP